MDQITIEAARRQDRTAVAALLKQLQNPWFRFCTGLLGNADDAQDAVQETAVRFMRDLPRFRGDSSIMTWSMGIALNVTREIKRKRRPAAQLDEETSGPAPPTHFGGGPVEQAFRSESRGLLLQSLELLPDRQREAVLLRFFHDLSVEQTAKVMGCAEGTVKATVHQALRTLRGRLNELA